MKIICDLDDFCDEHNCLEKLIGIRSFYKDFKVRVYGSRRTLMITILLSPS